LTFQLTSAKHISPARRLAGAAWEESNGKAH
jgi:hypothetical protein